MDPASLERVFPIMELYFAEVLVLCMHFPVTVATCRIPISHGFTIAR